MTVIRPDDFACGAVDESIVLFRAVEEEPFVSSIENFLEDFSFSLTE